MNKLASLKLKYSLNAVMIIISLAFCIAFTFKSIQGTQEYLYQNDVYQGVMQWLMAIALSAGAFLLQTVGARSKNAAEKGLYYFFAIVLMLLSMYSIWEGINKKISSDTKQEWQNNSELKKLEKAPDDIQASIEKIEQSIDQLSTNLSNADQTVQEISTKDCKDTRHKTKCRRDHQKKMQLVLDDKASDKQLLSELRKEKKEKLQEKKQAMADLKKYRKEMSESIENQQKTEFGINAVWSTMPDALSNLFYRIFIIFLLANSLIYRKIQGLQQKTNKQTTNYNNITTTLLDENRWSDVPNIAENRWRDDIIEQKAPLTFRATKAKYGAIKDNERWRNIAFEMVEDCYINAKQNRAGAWSFSYPPEGEEGGEIQPYAATQRKTGTHDHQIGLSLVGGGTHE